MSAIREILTDMIGKLPKTSGVKVNGDTHIFHDLGLDSFEMITLINNVENKFNIYFDVEELQYEVISNMDKLTNLIESKLSQS